MKGGDILDELRIVFGGDVCPTAHDERWFRDGNADALFGNLSKALLGADLAIVNLEAPLTASPSPLTKSGPSLRAHPECARALASAGIRLVNLANNHALDHGRPGVRSTVSACEALGLAVVGVGASAEAAARPFTRTVNGVTVSVYTMAEREFPGDGAGGAWVNPLDPMAFASWARLHRERIDFVAVIIHGGMEHYRYPSPRMRRTARFLVEQGADLVLYQHTHCPGCTETYRERQIFYGQGNLIFAGPGHPAGWYEGFLIEVRVRRRALPVARIIPYEQSLRQVGCRPLSGADKADFLSALEARSREILVPGFIETAWIAECELRSSQYLGALLGYGRLRSILNRLTSYGRRHLSASKLAVMANLVRCDTHNEALISILESAARRSGVRRATNDATGRRAGPE